MGRDKDGNYVNDNDVTFKIKDDKNGKTHIDFYDKSPREEDHSAVHVNYNSDTGKYESHYHNGDRSETDSSSGSCYLTSACMKYYSENFDDNCYELALLRWFRDNFVSKEDVEHYCQTAPIIVESIEKENNKGLVYNYIYDNVVDYCIRAIEKGDYAKAYTRYKNSILSLEEIFARKPLQERLVKAFKKATVN